MTAPPALPRGFNDLAFANLAAQSAEQISLAAVPIVAVMLLGAGAGEVGLLSAAQTLPFLLLSIPIGLMADRLSRQRLLVAAEVLRAAALVGLAGMAFSGQVSMAGLALMGFLGATGTVGFSVTAPALVPSLVPREALGAANGRLELARSLAFAGGPAVAGALVAAAGAPGAFVLATALSAAAIALLWRLHEPARVLAPRRHPWIELRQGAATVWQHSLLRPILLTAAAWNTAWFVLQAAYVPYAMKSLGLNAAAVGFTLAGYGVGMVIGALLAARVIRALPYGQAVILGPAMSVLAALVMLASIVWPSGWLAGAAFFLFGVGPIVWTISSTTLRQHLTPGPLLGRVSSIFLTVNMGARPLGAALGAWIGLHHGPAACLWVAAAGFVLQLAVIVGSPVRTLQQLPAPA